MDVGSARYHVRARGGIYLHPGQGRVRALAYVYRLVARSYAPELLLDRHTKDAVPYNLSDHDKC